MGRLIRINLLVLLLFLLMAELSGQLFFRIRNGYWLFLKSGEAYRNEIFSAHPYLSVALRPSVKVSSSRDGQYTTVTTTEIGTRWTGADLSDTSLTRIACIGGSTTFCTGVNDEDSWPALLQKKLGDRYAVVNFGIPAYNTVESLIQMALYVPELKPKYVIVHQGANDIYNYYQPNNYPDYFEHGEHLMPMALLARPKHESDIEMLRKRSGIFWMVNNIHDRIYPPELPHLHNRPDEIVDGLYIRNTKNMLTLADNMGAMTIMIGQVMNPHFNDFRHEPWSPRVKPELILPYTWRINEFTDSICKTDPNCTYVSLMDSIAWQSNHFWDVMHVTKEGSDLFADKVAEVVRLKEDGVQ